MGTRGLIRVAGAAVALLVLSGCAGGPVPAASPTTAPGEFPRPAATGEVLAQATVLQKDGEGPELCLGGVAESYPPQCGGPPILGWDWAGVKQSESASGVTWGSYAVTGIWDAAAFTVTQPPIPLALYDGPAPVAPWDDATNTGPNDESTLLRLQEEVHAADNRPATQAGWAEAPILSSWVGNGYLWVSVIYDDGSVQRFFDEQFGADVVVVQSALRDTDSATDSATGSAPSAAELPRPTTSEELTGQAMVLQLAGEAPMACVGDIAPSLPPQCGGPEVAGWDWADAEGAETASGVTWGTYALTGIWQGGVFTVTQPAVPVTREDPYARPDPRLLDEAKPGTTAAAELARHQEAVTAYLPQGIVDWSAPLVFGSGTRNGYLVVDVIYDDGSVQQFFDDQFGAGVVVVQSTLWPAG